MLYTPYYPYLNLGIAYYELKDYGQARKYLEEAKQWGIEPPEKVDWYLKQLSTQDISTPISPTLTPTGSTAIPRDIMELKKGVVKIEAQPEGELRKVGTGFIVRLKSGVAYIVTASHVVEGDKHPKVTFFTQPNRSFTATVTHLEGGDPRGLATLVIEGGTPPDLRVLNLDESIQISGGEPVTLIGFPRVAGTPWAVTQGTIVGRSGKHITCSGVANEGSSGGPLIGNGRVIGVVTEMTDQFVYATPAVIVRVTLEGWGIPLSN